MKIAVRGGHNFLAKGACGIIDETTEDRKVKDAVIKYLKQAGHSVLDVTPSNMDSSADLAYGVNKATNWGAELFISIHFNKAYDSYNGAIGSEVCVYNTFDMAQRVVNKLGSLGFKNRGQKVRQGLYELRKTSCKAMIVEVCFVEATEDVALYRKLGYDRIGMAIAEGVCGKSLNSTVTVSPTPQPQPSKNLYRVRLTWDDIKSQKGAYSVLDNAIEECKKYSDYKVFDEKGNVIYPKVSTPTIEHMYRVRKSWSDVKSQVGAYKDLNNAKAKCNEYIGYSVFDENGKSVYISIKQEVKPVEKPIEKPQPPKEETVKTPIMGKSILTKEQMAQYILKNNDNPKLSVSILELAELYLQEGELEGVRGDIAFCQAIKETGFFKFGGDVVPEQNNYCGLGTTGGGVKGAYFKTAKEGVKAQIQHLKAYASVEGLKSECVDPRYHLVSKGVAPNFEDLNGKWAVPGNNYGQEIIQIFEKIKLEKMEVKEETKEEIKEDINKKTEEVVNENNNEPKEDKESLIMTVLKLIIELLKKLLKK